MKKQTVPIPACYGSSAPPLSALFVTPRLPGHQARRLLDLKPGESIVVFQKQAAGVRMAAYVAGVEITALADGDTVRIWRLPTKWREGKFGECPDCFARPGEVHGDGCNFERCSGCGLLRTQEDHSKCCAHDPIFARWIGLDLGALLADHFGCDERALVQLGLHVPLFTKPVGRRSKCPKK